MRRLFLLIILIGWIKSISSQEITIYGQRSLWHADNLCNVNFTGCDYRQLDKGSLLGYAYHPNGSLWLVLYENLPNVYNRINIFDLQIEDCSYTLLYTIPLPKYWSCSSAANIDFLGRLYLNITEYDTILDKSIQTLSRIADPSQPAIERVFIKFPQQRFFEVHFAKDRIYMVEVDKPYIRVFDLNFLLLDTIIMQKHIWGLTSFSFGCDSTKTYATHMDISTEEFVASHPDTTMYISEYDFNTNTLTPVCSYWMGNNVANTQLTSPLEFLSSDPECDLLIDLDRDNSSGAYPYDYIDSTIYCATIQTPICDNDVYIHTSLPLDSIIIILSGILESGNEILNMQVAIPGMSFITRDDSTYVLISIAGTDSLYRQALMALRYEHNGQIRSAGVRQVVIQGYNAIKDGVRITARIEISSLPYAGEDVMLLICNDTIIGSLSSLTGGQPSGYWWPSLHAGGNTYNSNTDTLMAYNYIVGDQTCGNDTAIVTIARDTSGSIDLLGEDRTLCFGDTIEINADQGGTQIIWDDSSTNPTRMFTMAGYYWVSVATSDGCIYRDSLRINEGELWKPDIQTMDPVCGLSNGQIRIDSLEYSNGSALIINDVQLTKHYAGNLSQGSYQVTTLSKDGCKSDFGATLTDKLILAIKIDSILFVEDDSWQIIEYIELNSMNVFDIQFNPYTSIRWNGQLIEVFGDHDQQFTITFIDENGCVDTHFLNVKVEKVKGIYLPNIFSPDRNTGNELWQAFINEPYILKFIRIFDRWGNVVQESKLEASWDGTYNNRPCPSGVYVYQIVVTHTGSLEQKTLKGDITLLR